MPTTLKTSAMVTAFTDEPISFCLEAIVTGFSSNKGIVGDDVEGGSMTCTAGLKTHYHSLLLKGNTPQDMVVRVNRQTTAALFAENYTGLREWGKRMA